MGVQNALAFAFNRGEVGKLVLGRIDIERLRLAAEEQQNWLPLVSGPMTIRPGGAYLGSVKNDDTEKMIPFIFARDDCALLEQTDRVMRVWKNDALITRASVATAVTNGNFSSGTGWTLTATPGALADINSTTANQLTLHANALGSSAFAERSVTVAGGDQNVRHALRIVVTRGPVTFQVGSASGGEEYVKRTTLKTGTHSIAFTPTGATFYVRFTTNTPNYKIVDSITVEAAGTLELPTPWLEADFGLLRYDQSGDIVFVNCVGYQQRQIERRDNDSWSVVLYQSDNGPLTSPPMWADPITMTPGAQFGNTTLTASSAYFKSTHVGSLIRLPNAGQNQVRNIVTGNQFTDAIRIKGIGTEKNFSITLSGTWVGTVSFMRSVDGPDSGFTEFQDEAANGTYAIAPASTYDNVAIWYKVGFKAGEYSSGMAVSTIDTSSNGGSGGIGGDGAGIARITAFTSSTVVDIELLSMLKDTAACQGWQVGEWSFEYGHPSAVRFHDGRLFQFGRDRIWGSVSDDYYNFDFERTGDSAPISRSFGSGPVAYVNDALSLSRLIALREGVETSIRSSSFDEPLTPTAFSAKDCSSQGSARAAGVRIDKHGVFIQQSQRKVYALMFQVDQQDYVPKDLTRLNMDIGEALFSMMAVQRQPDTRIHFVRGDGVAPNLLYDIDDQVEGWWKVLMAPTLAGASTVEDVVVLPGTLEDSVYYVVKRTINGATKRFLEKMARLDQCTGLPGARLHDCHLVYSGLVSATIAVAHLEGETVCVWAWDDDDEQGVDLGEFTVASGTITLPAIYDNAVVGLEHQAKFKSAKLAYAAQAGTALSQMKKVDRLSLVLHNTHVGGVQFGPSYTVLDNLSQVIEGVAVGTDTILENYDEASLSFDGEWAADPRLHLVGSSRKPATVQAAVMAIETHEKI